MTDYETVDLGGTPVTDTTPVVAGPRGPAGPPAPTAAPLLQTAPASTWTYAHGLGLCPEVVVLVDSSPGARVYPDVTYPDLNTAVLTFAAAETGLAFAR